ncbi:MAG: rhomboid family intramembrane serine protease [Myxococcota bacterium]
MFDEFLLLATALVGIAFLRSTRRTELRPKGYTWVLAGILGLMLVAAVEGSRFVGVVAIALGSLVVVVPWLLESVARIFFSRGMLRAAVWAAGLRSMLMLGAGLGRQQEILRGLAVLEREGVDCAIDHFRVLANDTEDGGELALINEQIVSMMLYGQRWDDGIRHYEARFHPRYAAMRPALVLGLLRAYGEVGRLERAAALLQAFEDGPVGNDPRALGLVSQARLTFLVYAGAARPVDDALVESGRRLLGLSEASGALFRGLAARQAGDPSKARTELQRVEDLAGRRDDRVVESARRAIGELGAPPAVLEPVEVEDDLAPYVESVTRKLMAFIRSAPSIQRSGMLLATPGLLLAMGLGYFALRWLDHGGLGMLELGAPTVAMIRGGDWVRLWTAGWVHGDPIGLLLDLYTIWFAAPLVERVLGSGRVLVIAMLGGAVGVLISAYLGDEAGVILGGGGPASCAVAGAAGFILLTRRHPGLRGAAKRRIWMPFVMISVAQAVSLIPGLLAVEASWEGLLGAAVVGALFAMLPVRPGLRWAGAVVAGALAAWTGYAFSQVWVADEVAAIHQAAWTESAIGDVRISLPATFEPIEEHSDVPGLPLPLQVGMLDGVALRGGEMVEFATVVPDTDHAEDVPGLLLLDPSLGAELTLVPTPLPEVLRDAGVEDDATAHWVRRNGVRLGLTVTRALGSSPDAPRLVLFAEEGPLERQGSIYGRALASARAR